MYPIYAAKNLALCPSPNREVLYTSFPVLQSEYFLLRPGGIQVQPPLGQDLSDHHRACPERHREPCNSRELRSLRHSSWCRRWSQAAGPTPCTFFCTDAPRILTSLHYLTCTAALCTLTYTPATPLSSHTPHPWLLVHLHTHKLICTPHPAFAHTHPSTATPLLGVEVLFTRKPQRKLKSNK